MKLLLTSFVTNKKPKRMINTIHHLVNPVVGIDVGIPLNIFQNIFTNLHYGNDITTLKIISLQFLIGYYTYGKDRYKDALEYNDMPYNTNKKELYENLIKYKSIYKVSYDITFIMITSILLLDENSFNNMPLVILLLTSEYYKDLKDKLPIIKPVYVSIMWTISSIILPCVLYDDNYSILNYPIDYLPCFLNLFAATNIADIKDIEEDKLNGIETLPVKYGLDFTNYIILSSLILSSLLFGLNDNYMDRPIVNSLFELQNAGLSLIPFLVTNTTLI